MTYIDMGSGFRATGQGLLNDPGDKRFPVGDPRRSFRATEQNANGLLHNLGLPDGHRNHKLWLFVTGLQTGWKVAGAHSQTQRSRTFQPQHLMQDEMIIMGQAPSEYEYDRIVEFVTAHHTSALTDMDFANYELTTGREGKAINFRIVPYLPTNPGAINSAAHGSTPPINIDGYITGIEAGAERFQTAKPFELRVKVTDDKLQQPWETARVNGVLFQRYLAQFGGNAKALGGAWFTKEDIVDPGELMPFLEGDLVTDEPVIETSETADNVWFNITDMPIPGSGG